ncbi:hypothetical protein BY996DRAFT_6409954 [Phakopsora pachyrhizi]|uniref:Expressed protein n=1 Tax=Phakopsora pachyrhizi TaxID=170000 RepID=A0AAV0ASK3_PHAPC|nr:hypothetical protein BY996DRAFT_6409954 [Phakopsora pachyrhizi]CAH7672422.1 expressed protein [Phakopsora pachyrhizi]
MTNIDKNPEDEMGPLLPTYMPFFPINHSPCTSSSNTRQRDDYEQSIYLDIESPSLLVTRPDTIIDDDDSDDESQRARMVLNASMDCYLVCELPFASEPALETELEQELPPLKKIKSSSGPDEEVGERSCDGVVVLRTVKGILTRREGWSGWSSPATLSPQPNSPVSLERCFAPWTLGLRPGGLNGVPRTISRRSSSGASSAGTGPSVKAVRFASGNSILGCWAGTDPVSEEIEAPVAAVMYLTHSAEAYDRSPIVVEDGLRLPPRAKKEDDEGGWMKCKSHGSYKRLSKARAVKMKVESNKAMKFCTPSIKSPSSVDSDSLHSSTSSSDEDTHENSIVVKTFVGGKLYREAVEEEEDEEDVEEEEDKEDDCENEEGLENGPENDDRDEESDDEDRGRDDRMSGFGKWTSGDVFGSCDALGGF